MARVIPNNLYITTGDTDGISRNSTGSGPIGTSSSVPHDFSNSSLISKQVINSPAYQSAFKVLSQEKDKSWLQRLEMIPYSVQDASSTFLDDLGFSNNQNDKQSANYLYCLEQISALMSEYQSWKNTLPITQAQQFADAGINSAITGQGISSSEIPNVGVASDPSKLPSTNVSDFVFNAVDKFLSSSSGALDWISKFNEISLNNRRFIYDKNSAFAEFVTELSKDGVVLPSDIKSFDDLLASNDTEWFDTANARAKRLYNQYTEIRYMDAYGNTIIDETLKGDYRTGDIFATKFKDGKPIDSRFGSFSGASIDLSEYSKNIADLQYNLWLKDLEYRAEYAKQKKEWHDENGYTNAEDIELFESEIKASDKLIRKYEREKMELVIEYIRKLKKESDNGNVASRVQLMEMVYGLSSDASIADIGDDFWSAIVAKLEDLF